ncbi:MAG: hypothetical protein ACI837_003111 [Crocinitomicaceae bacterium]|jgi:hypothetical protein
MRILFVLFLALNSNAQSEFSLKNNWKLIQKGTRINEGDIKLRGTILNPMFKFLASTKLSKGLLKDSSYIISINAALPPGVELGILIYDDRSINIRKNPASGIFPQIFTSGGSRDRSDSFVATGEENRVALMIRKVKGETIDEVLNLKINNFDISLSPVMYGETNLISNGSFERYSVLVQKFSAKSFSLCGSILSWNEDVPKLPLADDLRLNYAEEISYTGVNASSSYFLGTPDIYYESKEDTAYDGKLYAGINLVSFYDGALQRGREYLQTKLSRELNEGEKIRVEFAYKLQHERSNIPTNAIGICITKEPLLKTFPIDSLLIISELGTSVTDLAEAQDWTVISFEFEAKGGEKYLTLGDFNQTNFSRLKGKRNFSSYYFIDGIVVQSH